MSLPSNRPAVPWALSLVAGIVLAEWGVLPLHLLVLCCGLLILGGMAVFRGRFVWFSALVLAAATGAWLLQEARDGARARIVGWLPEDGTAVELHILGRLLDIPETGKDGEYAVRISGQPERGGHAPPARVLLWVSGSARDATPQMARLRPGDLVRVWCKVRRPRRRGGPEEVDPETALLARGLDATGTVKNAHLVMLVERGPRSVRRLLGSVKVSARRGLDRVAGAGGRSRVVLGAMLLGDRAALEASDWRMLRDAGLVHLLSVSGLHVGLALAAFLAIVGRTPLGPFGTFTTLVAAVAAIAIVTGGQPPVLRSALSAGLMLLGRAVGREGDAVNTLAVAATGLAVVRPHILWDPSFQLTVTATAGLLLFSRGFALALPLPRPIALSLGISASAYLAALPWTLLHFGRATPVSVLSNLAASVLCALSLTSGGAALATAEVPVLGDWLCRAARGSVEALLGFASAMTAIPAGSFRVGSPPPVIVAGYLALLFLAAHPAGIFRSGPRSAAFFRLLRLAICLALGLLHVGFPPPGPSGSSEVAVLDVGQGQAVVLRGPSGGFLLVDAGGSAGGRFDSGERTVAPYLARRGCRRLEALVVSHGHDDHIGGVDAILRDFEVGELWVAPGALRSGRMERIAGLAVERGTALVLVEGGFQAPRAGMDVSVLHPTRHESGALSENDRSVVVRATAGGSSILVPGDLEAPGEGALLARGAVLTADALIVGHHGAARASGPRFLDAVSPRVAVVSVGKGNRFGHPDAEVLERLRKRGAAIFRTDRHGRILLRSSHRGWSAEPAFRGVRSGPE